MRFGLLVFYWSFFRIDVPAIRASVRSEIASEGLAFVVCRPWLARRAARDSDGFLCSAVQPGALTSAKVIKPVARSKQIAAAELLGRSVECLVTLLTRSLSLVYLAFLFNHPWWRHVVRVETAKEGLLLGTCFHESSAGSRPAAAW